MITARVEKIQGEVFSAAHTKYIHLVSTYRVTATTTETSLDDDWVDQRLCISKHRLMNLYLLIRVVVEPLNAIIMGIIATMGHRGCAVE